MSFSNLPINIEGLPEVQAVSFKPIHPDYLKVLRINWGIVFLLIAGIIVTIFTLTKKLQNPLAISIVSGIYLLLVLFTVIIGTGSFRRKQYAIREKDILYKTGWIFQNLHMVPFNRLQHCVVNMGPIERRFGLATLSLYTAASEGKDITIHGLPQTEAEQLKELIIQQIQALHTDENI
ncbi:MAG: PH domain-containing protein [Bacteroidota bacterium]